MTDAPKSPKRRRRKIIVAFVLVLVSLFSWWYWPRGDTRFVGKWGLAADPAGTLQVANGQTLTFFRHGLGNGSAGGPGVTLFWRVEENQLITGIANPSGWSARAFECLIWIQQRLTPSVQLLEGRYEIISTDQNVIILRPQGSNSRLILTRLPE